MQSLRTPRTRRNYSNIIWENQTSREKRKFELAFLIHLWITIAPLQLVITGTNQWIDRVAPEEYKANSFEKK